MTKNIYDIEIEGLKIKLLVIVKFLLQILQLLALLRHLKNIK